MYSHILTPMAADYETRGPAALAVAEALLDEGGRVTLLHVQETIPSYVESYIPKEVIKKTGDEIRRGLETLAKDKAYRVDVAVVTGKAPTMIVDYAERHGADCIVIASHRPGVADYILGSTAAWVARHADSAVHILR
ncbi:universal stress protein [Pikeienuella piscinae]|uniref:Universal stress protein n=1 Tax=Pikeienuella piscinae TaxID=2748098 RepID=A0A7L5BT96_9RHOB|nr:universal stress protein [Pikeienuella piscinae]QIE54201.1 universal stress protein [Pikeienuella piscinae]